MELGNLQVSLLATQPDLMNAVHIAALGFSKEETTELILDVKSHLESGKLVYRIFANGQEVGFAIFEIYEDIIYLSGVIIIPEFQGKGIVQFVVKQVQALYPKAEYIALRTQSLRMYLAATKICSEFYPTLKSLDVPDKFRSRGNKIAKLINSEFPLHKKCYGGQLYGTKPVYKDQALQSLWDKLCNFEEGDAIIFVGKLS